MKVSYLLKWGSFSPNEVRRIVQHVKKGGGRKEGKKERTATVQNIGKRHPWNNNPLKIYLTVEIEFRIPGSEDNDITTKPCARINLISRG